MKNQIKILTAISLAIVTVFVSIAVAVAGTPNVTGSESVQQAIVDLGVTEGDINLIDEHENAYGDKQFTYADDKYTYYMDAASSELIFAVMNSDKMTVLVENALEITPLEIAKADELFASELQKLFPQYDIKNLTVNVITDNGSPIDYFIYEAQEISGDIVVNRANISFGIDGSLTSFGGTYNKLDDFEGSDKYNKDEIALIAYNYLLSIKEEVEKAMIPSEDTGADIKTNGGEGVILPDGVKSIDDVVEEQLPEYKLYLNSVADLDNIAINREMHNGKVVWFANFTIKTSWGEVDSIFNPMISMEIDAMNGEIIEVLSTDGA